MKKRTCFVVFHTTESGADYAVKTGLKDRRAALAWITENRESYPRPLIIRKINF